ncbi:Immuno-dominant variable surface antigen-like [Histomonas meleagridis]|uniref:Immuno-dominant variable surface antigen-like n=1 Tax=Histomonas meleagridis TaxID=135588 RepID=UPI00355A3688|nr:Immuno-dominant variable surface antigen-like [Histomonas meleagridis]KAH0802776.1 Immuno-dominant variable surface antigen-like [Histomonas meleagridis]
MKSVPRRYRIMIAFFSLLAIFFVHSQCYTKSAFGYPGTDTVQAQEFDSYEILEEVTKPANVKPFSLLRNLYPDKYPKILDHQYGYPGHYPSEQERCQQEATAMKEDFCRNSPDLTQDDLYAHPVGIQNLIGDKDAIDKAPRYKVRYIFNPRYASQHTTALYVPPGELITIELPEGHANAVKLSVNTHAEDVKVSASQVIDRYPSLRCTTDLKPTTGRITKFGWPLGGNLIFTFNIDKFQNNFEMNISGVVLAPHFVYGVTSDEEWEEQIRQYPGAYAFLDTGAIHVQLSSSLVRNTVQLNDAMAFLRGMSVITYSAGEIANNDRRSDGRVKNPNYWYVDSYVSLGEAYATIGGNNIHAPNHWASSIVSHQSQRKGCWGMIHEYGHHFQDWGFDKSDEVTNNIYAIIIYSLYTPISSTRKPKGDGTMTATTSDSWSFVTHQNGILTYSEKGDKLLLTLFANLMYAFGQEKTLEIIHASRYNTYYTYKDNDPSSYTRPARYFFTACKVLQRNLIPYFTSYADKIPRAKIEDTSIYKPEAIEELKKQNYKEFHPVALVYQCGYLIDGVETETARPYQVPAGHTTRLYFIRDMLTRAKYGMHDFEFVKYYGGENATFTEVEEGTYDYTPKDKLLNKFYVVYRDKENKEETICVVKIQPVVQYGETLEYHKVSFTANDLSKTFSTIQGKEPSSTYATEGIVINNIKETSKLPWLCINKGKFVPPQSGTYVFYMKHDEEAAFYISENELSGNPTDDEQYKVLSLNQWHTNYDKNCPSSDVPLEKGKEYYYQFVMQNQNGDGGGSVGYRIKDSTGKFLTDNVNEISKDMLILNGYSSKDIIDFVPNIPTFKWNFGYKGTNGVVPLPDNFTFSKYPKLLNGENINKSVNGGKCDQCRTRAVTEIPFPQEFEIDFNGTISFNEIVLGTNQGNFKMNSTIELRCDNSQIYFGHYYSMDDQIKFDQSYTCSKLQWITYNNTEKWLNGNAGGTSIRKIEFKQSALCDHIIPITHSKINIKDLYVQRAGIYYNGKGYIAKDKGEISFKFTKTSNIGIIGDLYEFGGNAKVYLDDQEIGKFDTSKLSEAQKQSRVNGKYTRLYMTVLFVKNRIDKEKEHVLKITDFKGEVGIAGFIADDEVELLGEGTVVPPEPEPETTETTTETSEKESETTQTETTSEEAATSSDVSSEETQTTSQEETDVTSESTHEESSQTTTESEEETSTTSDITTSEETTITSEVETSTSSEVSSEETQTTSEEMTVVTSSDISSEVSSEETQTTSEEMTVVTSSDISSEVSSEETQTTSEEMTVVTSSDISSEVSSEETQITTEEATGTSSEEAKITSDISSDITSDTSSEVSSEETQITSEEVTIITSTEISSEETKITSEEAADTSSEAKITSDVSHTDTAVASDTTSEVDTPSEDTTHDFDNSNSDSNGENSNSLGSGAIAGIAIGVVAGVAAIVVVSIIVVKKKMSKASMTSIPDV